MTEDALNRIEQGNYRCPLTTIARLTAEVRRLRGLIAENHQPVKVRGEMYSPQWVVEALGTK